jgi:hypothetical protein
VIGRRAPFLILGLALFLAGCAAQPSPEVATEVVYPSPPGSAPNTTATATLRPDGSPSPLPQEGPCSAQLVERVRAAVDSVEAYSYRVAGFVFQPVFDPDPLATPATERVPTALEGAYQAPDRSSLSHSGVGSRPGAEATVSIGRDLYVETEDGWVKLPDAADPRLANVLAGLLEDAGSGWQGETTAGGSCRLVARRALPGGSGERQTVIFPDPRTALPSRLEVDVTGAIGRNGETNDLGLVYLFRYDPSLTIEPPI